MVVGLVLAGLDPGILVGAALALLWQWRRQPTLARRLLRGSIAAVSLVALSRYIVWGWPWRDWLSQIAALHITPVAASTSLRSAAIEVLAGPLWLEAALVIHNFRRRTISSQIRQDHRHDRERWDALSRHAQRAGLLPRQRTRSESAPPHPAGRIRLGIDLEAGRPLDLELQSELGAHVSLIGVSGSGKTSTVGRILDGALANGYCTVVIDCKAGGLGPTARQLAEHYNAPLRIVDPASQQSLGYNPCVGDGPAVANKLVGTFSFGPNAEIYKNIALEATSLAVRALRRTRQPVTLASLYDAFAPRGLAKLAHTITDDETLRARLLALDSPETDRVSASGRAGLQRRLGALIEGRFGALFANPHALDWTATTTDVGVTYVALSALASSEDTQLMGRVIVQDLKELCAQRLQHIASGHEVEPLLLAIDEFAALDEPKQLLDLLRQSREARVSIIVATQHMPVDVELQRVFLGAGLLIAHRISAPDVEAVASQFGTRQATDVTHQVDYTTGLSDKGSIRRVDKFRVHPNELRELVPGRAALKSAHRQRYALVQVYAVSASVVSD